MGYMVEKSFFGARSIDRLMKGRFSCFVPFLICKVAFIHRNDCDCINVRPCVVLTPDSMAHQLRLN